MIKPLMAVALIAATSTDNGCNYQEPTKPDTVPLEIQKNTESGPSRFQVVTVGVFDDDLAYHGKRGIYILTDNKTGEEFVGISGVGIAELGEHGKATTHEQ